MKFALGFGITTIIIIIAYFLLYGHDNVKPTVVYPTSVSECNQLPSSFEWLGRKYVLKTTHNSLEPGMKFGYLRCISGQLVNVNDDWNSIIVYDAPETDIRDMILITPNGEQLLYIPL